MIESGISSGIQSLISYSDGASGGGEVVDSTTTIQSDLDLGEFDGGGKENKFWVTNLVIPENATLKDATLCGLGGDDDPRMVRITGDDATIQNVIIDGLDRDYHTGLHAENALRSTLTDLTVRNFLQQPDAVGGTVGIEYDDGVNNATLTRVTIENIRSDNPDTDISVRGVRFSDPGNGPTGVVITDLEVTNVYSSYTGGAGNADGFVSQGWATTPDITLVDPVFNNPGKRAVKCQSGGLTITNITVNYTAPMQGNGFATIPVEFQVPGTTGSSLVGGTINSLDFGFYDGVFACVQNGATISGVTVNVPLNGGTPIQGGLDGLELNDGAGPLNFTNNTFNGAYRRDYDTLQITAPIGFIDTTGTTFESVLVSADPNEVPE